MLPLSPGYNFNTINKEVISVDGLEMAEAMAGYVNEEDGGGDVVFNPPLYQQRYQAVLEVARKHMPMKVTMR